MSQRKITLYCLGADSPWHQIESSIPNRRNTCLIKALSRKENIQLVVVTVIANRLAWLKAVFTINIANSNSLDLYLPIWIPGQNRSELISKLNRKLDRLFVKAHAIFNKLPKEKCIFAYWPKGLRQVASFSKNYPVIFDADHNIVDDENFSEIQKNKIKELLNKNKDRKLIGISASRTMQNHFAKWGLDQKRVRNGVSPERFNNEYIQPPDIKRIKRPIIGYVGTLSKWMNYNLMIELAEKRSDWSFIIVGETYKNTLDQNTGLPKNINFLGRKSSELTSDLIRSFDVALSLYRKLDWMDPDSMKIYEYLAAEIPVVTTSYHQNIKSDFDNLIDAADSVEEMETEIERALNRSDNEREDWRNKVMKFLKTNTWEDRASEISNIIRNQLV